MERNLTTRASKERKAEVTAQAMDEYHTPPVIASMGCVVFPVSCEQPRVVAVTLERKAALADRLMFMVARPSFCCASRILASPVNARQRARVNHRLAFIDTGARSRTFVRERIQLRANCRLDYFAENDEVVPGVPTALKRSMSESAV